MAPTPLELTGQAASVFRDRGFENGRLEAELLLASVLGLKRLDLYLQFERPIVEDELVRFRAAVRRRLRHEPIQYILGETAFRSLSLRVDSRVLIPRPETEILVGEVLRWAAGRANARAVDIGTGSGAIALSLAQEGEFGAIVATDVAAASLDVARENAARLGLESRVEFRLGDAWAAVRDEERFDIVVSNPPYVSESDRAGLQPEVRDWEPATALFAGRDGLAVLECLIDGAPDRLVCGGLLALEMGAGQAGAVRARAERSGAWTSVRVVADLNGHDRIVLAERG